MKYRKRLLLMTLCLTFILPVSVTHSRTVYAAGEITISSPLADNRITDQYVVRYSVSETIRPQSIQVSYRDAHGATATVEVIPNDASTDKTSYTTLIQGLDEGENIITVASVGADGRLYTNQRRVIVDYKLTNIHSDEESVRPYVTDPNKFKNLLKANNALAVQNTAIPPKDDAFVSRFVDLLFEEAQVEAIRADIVFAQIMLETGWLSFKYDVRETQNNFGGLGATGDGVRGNVFPGMREGIRANVQHLLAYGSTREITGELIDPRFHYVPRGVSPAMEYLGFQENVLGGGWAMGHQYGYKIRNIIERVEAASAAAFAGTAGKALISEMEVSSIKRSKYNALDINLVSGFSAGQEVRLAVATNSDTEHRFTFTNTTTGATASTEWSEEKAAFYTPVGEGVYTFTTEIRDRHTKIPGESKTTEIVIGGTLPSSAGLETDSEVVPVIGSVHLSSSPYMTDKEVEIFIADISEETVKLNEYQVEVELDGAVIFISPWSDSRIYRFTPSQSGPHLLRVSARNRLVPSGTPQRVTVTIEVKETEETEAPETP